MTTDEKLQQQLLQQANLFWQALKDVRQGKLSLKATTKEKGNDNDR